MQAGGSKNKDCATSAEQLLQSTVSRDAKKPNTDSSEVEHVNEAAVAHVPPQILTSSPQQQPEQADAKNVHTNTVSFPVRNYKVNR